VTIAGDFLGSIVGDGKVGNVALSGTGRFKGILHGGTLSNITANSFTGTTETGPRHTITATGRMGNIVPRSAA